MDQVKGRSLALPTSSGVAALASSEDEAIEPDQVSEEQISNDYEDLNDNPKSENHPSFQQNHKRILANIAQRKKLATPAPSNRDENRTASRTSLDESLYSSVANEVYTKIGSSPGSNHGGGQKLLSGNNGTASVIEVIEPTASEEAEFKQALKEMNWSGIEPQTPQMRPETSPITIFPRDELRASLMTTTSSASPVEFRHHARPAQVRSPTSSKASRDSIRSRYSAGDLSPTKRLMEMGISVTDETRPSPNAEQVEVNDQDSNHRSTDHKSMTVTPSSVRKSSTTSNFFQKIASKTKLMKRSPIQMYANIDIDNAIGPKSSNSLSLHQEIYRNPEMLGHSGPNSNETAEEHILPDSFDEILEDKNTNDNGTGNGPSSVSPLGMATHSNVSPSSRKSASSHASRGSQDSGIGIPVNKTPNAGNSTIIVANNHDSVRPSQGNSNTVVMQVGVATHSSVGGHAHHHHTKRTVDFNKAWYDVPSDDETEAPEADSLASIISHRGSSDDEN